MTAEQQKLVEENVGLVYYYVYAKLKMQDEDLIQDGMVGLCVAADRYKDADKNKFKKFAMRYISGYIKNSLNKRSKIAESLCLEQVLKKECYDGEKILQENAHCSALIESLQEELSERYKNIPDLLLDGYTQTEVASILGVPRQRVYEKVKAMREYLKERSFVENEYFHKK